MDAVFKKLNFKAHNPVLIMNAPDSFALNIASIADEATIVTNEDQIKHTTFCMIFVTKQTEIDATIPSIMPLLTGDAILWMCYPKGTSKRYQCDFNRDSGWQVMGQFDMEPVRMVAIDEDWSALRFKKVDFIKTMKRNTAGALSEKGKIKSSRNS
ncbi:MAG TPA: hypothetical protein VGN64_01550 [Dyadobacter sp.]|nr:hypothetical protein [Dyadobacter sp.]